jgi:glycosyltransferase involved in cell wall biosynthesis
MEEVRPSKYPVNFSWPKVSIILPSYNHGHLIETAILSILRQNYPNLELLIVDGGSTDETLAIISKYKEQISYFCSEKDNGVYDAMNKGISSSSGEWLYFLGADDQLLPNVLIDIFSIEKITESDMIWGDVLDQSFGLKSGERNTAEAFIKENIFHQGVLYKRQLFEKHGLYDLRYSLAADRFFNAKCFADNSIKKRYIPIIIANYSGKGMSSKSYDTLFEKEKYQIFLNLFGKEIPENKILHLVFSRERLLIGYYLIKRDYRNLIKQIFELHKNVLNLHQFLQVLLFRKHHIN